MDVETDMDTVQCLLLDKWNLPKPKWILSLMGEVHEKKSDNTGNISQEERQEREIEQERKQTQLQTHVNDAVKFLSNGQGKGASIYF